MRSTGKGLDPQNLLLVNQMMETIGDFVQEDAAPLLPEDLEEAETSEK